MANKLVMLLDEISTGLDSSTTFQICRCIQQMAHLRGATVLVSLLQPPPETFNLFDDIFLLAEGVTCLFVMRQTGSIPSIICIAMRIHKLRASSSLSGFTAMFW